MSRNPNDHQSYQNNESVTLQTLLQLHGLEMGEDGVIRWKPNASQHPRSWKMSRKLYDTSLIIFLDFFTYGEIIPK